MRAPRPSQQQQQADRCRISRWRVPHSRAGRGRAAGRFAGKPAWARQAWLPGRDIVAQMRQRCKLVASYDRCISTASVPSPTASPAHGFLVMSRASSLLGVALVFAAAGALLGTCWAAAGSQGPDEPPLPLPEGILARALQLAARQADESDDRERSRTEVEEVHGEEHQELEGRNCQAPSEFIPSHDWQEVLGGPNTASVPAFCACVCSYTPWRPNVPVISTGSIIRLRNPCRSLFTHSL